MTFIIKNKKELNKYISENGDCDPETTYLAQNKETEDCFAIFGCTYATEAFRACGSTDEYNLVITDDDYDKEIEEQINSDSPDLNGFNLK